MLLLWLFADSIKKVASTVSNEHVLALLAEQRVVQIPADERVLSRAAEESRVPEVGRRAIEADRVIPTPAVHDHGSATTDGEVERAEVRFEDHAHLAVNDLPLHDD